MEIVKIIQEIKFKGDFEARIQQLRSKIIEKPKPLNSILRILMRLEKEPESINLEYLVNCMKKRSLATPNRTCLLIVPKEEYQKQFPDANSEELHFSYEKNN